MDHELLAEVLTRIEVAETELLSWGLVNSQFSEAEFEQLLADVIPQAPTRAEIRDALLEDVLVVRTPSGGFRSRMAETLRLLSRLRQTFPNQQWWQGVPLVLDYRFAHRPRRRPTRSLGRDAAIGSLDSDLPSGARRAASALAPDFVSEFQVRAVREVLAGLRSATDAGVMVTAGTGSGKTLAFYWPALTWIRTSIREEPSEWVRLLALYPRGELLKDQLRAVLQLSRRAGESGQRPIRVGTWFGPTPRAALWLQRGWAQGWREVRQGGTTSGWLCPFLVCPDCAESMVWRLADVEARRERLHCSGCRTVLDDSYITLTRERAAAHPPDVMFTTTESLNRQLAAPDQHRAFGLRGERQLRMVLLDEVHTYEGTSGAQNSLLLRRLRRMTRGPILWSGLSATLENAEEFFAGFVNLYVDRVSLVAPQLTELEESGAEYLVALRHDPGSQTGPLSVTIQAAMALARCLDAPGSPYEPAPSSKGLYGTRLFVFTDKLDVTNRLYWDLLDAEGWWQRNRPKNRRILTLAHLRGEEQSRRGVATREDPSDRDEPGQWWWLPERLGRDLDGDEQLLVGRTSSQDAGVDSDADVIVATATLEVGYDDEAVGAVLQHKAPHDLARFVQRKGRAGRDPRMRPWTVVVLSDWGRDRLHWQLYDQLFNPELEPRYLPIHNRYVLRMQAAYSTLDWLGGRLASVGDDRSAWADLAGPAELLESNQQRIRQRSERQQRAAALLREVLDGGPARDHLRSHLRRALGFGDDDGGWAELDALLWSPPRPLLLAVLPTALRRLTSAWAGEVPAVDDIGVRTRTPLREFIAGNLFDDLLLPEVEILVPTAADASAYESALLPTIRTLRELMPGNVTRHFGVSTFSRRHWVPLPDADGHQISVDVTAAYGAEYVGETVSHHGLRVRLFRPGSVRLSVPPERVRDASSVQPRWDYRIDPLGSGRTLEISRGRWSDLFSGLVFHTHALGDGVRIQRFACAAEGSVFAGGAPKPIAIQFTALGDDTSAVGLGVELEADALRLEIHVPSPASQPTPAERSDRLAAVFTEDPRLPPNMTWFQRSALVSALLVLIADTGSAGTIDLEDDGTLGQLLEDALHRLGMAVVIDPRAADLADADPTTGHQPQNDMQRWCRDSTVIAVAIDSLRLATSDRDATWEIWLQRRLAATAAAVFLEAACLASSEMSVDDLAIDVGAPVGMSISVWLSEMSPGGNGQIEHLQRTLAEDPQRFVRLLDRSIEATDIESLDRDVRRFIELSGSDDHLTGLSEGVRSAWIAGHKAVADAFLFLRQRVAGLGARPSRAAWTTIANRLVGPGAHSSLIPTAGRLLERWDEHERACGFAVSSREFGALCHDDVTLDGIFRLESPSPGMRSRAVSNFFWPRSTTARLGSDAPDPFGLLPLVDRSLLRLHLPPRLPPVQVSNWDGEVRKAIYGRLREIGSVDLAFEPGAEQLAREIVLSLQDDPLEVGALLLHPNVVGVRQRNGHLIVALALPEVA